MKHLLTLLLLITFNANAEFTIKFGGWSKHSSATYGNGIKYNESHDGYGFDYEFYSSFKNVTFLTGYWYMKDSYNKDSFQFGLGARYKVNKYIDINLVITHFNRSAVFIQNGVYDEDGWEKFKIKRTEFVYPLPYVTINLTEKLNMDIMALINPFQGGDSVIFARLGYTF